MGYNRMIAESLNILKTDWKPIIEKILIDFPLLEKQLNDILNKTKKKFFLLKN